MDENTNSNRMSATNNESVQVIVRCRPIDSREKRMECSEIVRVYSNRGVIEVENPKSRSENEPNKIFTYDAVYDENSTQASLYDETVRPLVASVLDGYNGCVFAYGQTGTGKTYTMEGIGLSDHTPALTDSEGDLGKGVIPRAFDQIWAHINRTTGTEFLVSVRYLEIYMENIRDLLRVKSTKPLELREQSGRGVFVSHLHSQTCRSAADMLKAMKLGNHNRTTGATNMNEHSSRSHAIFQIVVEMVNNIQPGDSPSQQQQQERTAKVGKLNLIDLAGSERQSKSGASGDRLKEATKINKSLSALGNVIYALAESSPHIPYRDSKLTRLLQDSLGGNSKTIMIANVGPASMNYDETIITLRYAYRAKSIKNQPIKNEDCRDAKLLELQDEISRLRALIASKTSGKLDLSSLLLQDGSATSLVDSSVCSSTSSSSEDEGEGGAHEGGQQQRLKRLQSGKVEVDELGKKLRQLEKQMVHGGKNIVDSVNENEVRLEEHKTEISKRKKREIEMQQQLELEEESCEVIRQKFNNIQQEVDYKRDMFKKLHNRLQGLRQEIQDNHSNYMKDRQELAEANDEATMQVRQKLLIIDNFLPSEERSRLLGLAHFNEDLDNWQLSRTTTTAQQQRQAPRYQPSQRPVAARANSAQHHQHYRRRPITEYALTRAIATTGLRYRSENILDLKLELPLRTTRDYAAPSICPQVKAAVRDIIAQDERNCHVIIKGGATTNVVVVGSSRHHSANNSQQQQAGISKAELEGRYKRASRNTVDIQTARRTVANNRHDNMLYALDKVVSTSPALFVHIPPYFPPSSSSAKCLRRPSTMSTSHPHSSPTQQQQQRHRRHVGRHSLSNSGSSSNAPPPTNNAATTALNRVRGSYSDSYITNMK